MKEGKKLAEQHISVLNAVYDRIDQSIFLHSLNVEIPTAEIYRRINF